MHSTVLTLLTHELYHIASMIHDVRDLVAFCSSNPMFVSVCRDVFASKLLPGIHLYELAKRLATQDGHYFYLAIQDEQDLYSRLSLIIKDGNVTVRVVYGFANGGIIFQQCIITNETMSTDFKIVDNYFQKHFGSGESTATVIIGGKTVDVLHGHLAAFIKSIYT